MSTAASPHGLRSAALGLASGVAIGVASTAPAYSLAATLGLVSKELGPSSTAAPAVLLIAVLPILCIAVAFDRLNRRESDCGTTFAWVTRSMGPWVGWMAGWITLVAGVLVMASLAQIAGIYTFHLLGLDALAAAKPAVALAGTGWIVLATWICVRGIEPTAHLQYALVAAELLALVAFSVAALAAVIGPHAPAHAAKPALSWFGLAAVDSSSALAGAVVAAIFLYWGWESALSLNEETKDPVRTPGLAGIVSVVVLVFVYVLAATAAQSVHGPAFLVEHEDDVLSPLARDVLSSPWDLLVTFAVLSSAIASCQTTLLPTARTALSMAAAGALHPVLASIHPRSRSPHIATWILGAASCLWFAALSLAGADVLADSILSIGLLAAFSYAVTGYACPLLYARSGMRWGKQALALVAAPLAGAAALSWVFVRMCFSLAGLPLLLGIGAFLAGAVLMLARFFADRSFFTED